jgi:hypothetical protein
VAEQSMAERPGFHPDLVGRRAECDGGGMLVGTRYAGRQEFTGTLTGEYVEVGDPASRWYLMVDLTEKPRNFEAEAVWCLSGNLFFCDQGPTWESMKEAT